MTRPTRRTAARRAYLDLQRRARAEGRPTHELLTLYLVERWLARLAVSPYAEQFVLKGGILLAAFDARRPTADIDALARNFANDEATVLARIIAIAEQSIPDDGVEYRTQTVTSRVIRDEDLYSGCASRWTAESRPRSSSCVWTSTSATRSLPQPQQIDLPALRPEHPPIRILGYPLETVLAEKITTAISLGPANTRVRDYADIYTLTGDRAISHSAARGADRNGQSPRDRCCRIVVGDRRPYRAEETFVRRLPSRPRTRCRCAATGIRHRGAGGPRLRRSAHQRGNADNDVERFDACLDRLSVGSGWPADESCKGELGSETEDRGRIALISD